MTRKPLKKQTSKYTLCAVLDVNQDDSNGYCIRLEQRSSRIISTLSKRASSTRGINLFFHHDSPSRFNEVDPDGRTNGG